MEIVDKDKIIDILASEYSNINKSTHNESTYEWSSGYKKGFLKALQLVLNYEFEEGK